MSCFPPKCPGFIDAAGQCYTTVYTINLYNNTSTPVPAGYPIPIWLGVPGANASYSNVRLVYIGKEVTTWVERVTSGTAFMWIVLPTELTTTIPLEVWVGQQSYIYDGVAGAYKELAGCNFDNGSKVFTLYDNFCGTSLNTNLWNLYVDGQYSYEVNNDLILSVSQGQTGYVVLQSKQTFGQGYMFDVMSTITNFGTSMRTAQPSFSVGNGPAFAFADNIGVIPTTTTAETADFSINGNCIAYYVHELGTQSTTAPTSCPSSSASYCQTPVATYMVTGINYPFRKMVSGLYYYNNNSALFLNYSLINESLPGQSISGNVYMYLGWQYYQVTPDNSNPMQLIYHFARVYPMVPVFNSATLTPPFYATNSGNIQDMYYSFNGSAYLYGEIPQLNAFNFPVTYALWINTTASNGIILGDANVAPGSTASAQDIILALVNGKLVAGYNCALVTSTNTYNDGNWHFVVVVINYPSSITLYVDGQEVGTASVSSMSPPSPYYLYIGYSPYNSTCYTNAGEQGYFSGNIAWVAAFNTALTASQIQEIYSLGVNTPIPFEFTDSLVGYWAPINGVNDLTTNNNNLTNNNVVVNGGALYTYYGPNYVSSYHYYNTGTYYETSAFVAEQSTILDYFIPGVLSSPLYTLTISGINQVGGYVFGYTYNQGNMLTVSGTFAVTNISSCSTNDAFYALFASSFNMSNILPVLCNNGQCSSSSATYCTAQGSITIPEPSSPTIVTQYDVYGAEPCGYNNVGQGGNVWIVNGTTVTNVACSAGSGTFNTNIPSNSQFFYMNSFIPAGSPFAPSFAYLCWTFLYLPNKQFSSACYGLSGYNTPVSGTYYMAAGGVNGPYGQWSLLPNTLYVSQ